MELMNISRKLGIHSIVFGLLMMLNSFVFAVNSSNLCAQEGTLVPAVQAFRGEDHQATAPVRIGETFHIVLMANPSAGYEWQFEELDTSMFELGKVLFRPTSDLLGAPAEQIIPLKPLRRGQAALLLRYKRPWEKETRLQAEEGLQNFMMNVTVGD